MSDKIKKLSQAIRLGATFKPKCRGMLFGISDSKQAMIGSCAIGAAYEAVTGSDDCVNTDYASTMLKKRFNLREGVIERVIHRNDKWDDTREEIADWLEGQGL